MSEPRPGGGTTPSVRAATGPVASVSTRDPDEFRAWVARRYVDHEQRIRPRSADFGFAGEFAAAGGLRWVRTAYREVVVDIDCPPLPVVTVAQMAAGHGVVTWSGSAVPVGPGSTVLVPPSGSRGRYDGNDVTNVGVALDTVLRVGAEASGLDPALVRFVGLEASSAGAERRWLATADYVRHGLRTGIFENDLVRSAAEDLLAALALATFPNTASTVEVRTPRDPATPAVVRRAAAYIDAHAAEAVTVTDIAAAVGVVPRTLQYAFRRHRGTTPMAYVRRARLARAHEELALAQPGDGTTVAQVAARWGYARAHRFAAAYRDAYGVPPSMTLRS